LGCRHHMCTTGFIGGIRCGIRPEPTKTCGLPAPPMRWPRGSPANRRRKSPRPPFGPDGTERPLHRPKDPADQQAYDRGKQKGHPLKNLLVRNDTCPMCVLSRTCEGNASDQHLAELASFTLPSGRCLSQAKGFQGFFLPGITSCQPKKNPVAVNSPQRRRRRLVVSRPSACGVNPRVAGSNAIGW
jgi:hypothetical protein